MPISEPTSDEENLTSETESETETEVYTSENEYDPTPATNSDMEVDSDDNFPETQPLFETPKKEKPKSEKQNADKAKELKGTDSTTIYGGWEIQNQVSTKDIDFSKWQAGNLNRDSFFIGPDHYLYNNSSTMKKFVHLLKKGKIDEKLISIPIEPMTKVIAVNPRTTIGLTGTRFFYQNGGGYGVTPIFYLEKEYVRLYIFFSLILL